MPLHLYIIHCAEFCHDLRCLALLVRQVALHYILVLIEDSDRGNLIFEIWVRACVRMPLLEVNVGVQFFHIFAELRQFVIKILIQLLAPNLLRAAIYD